MLLSLKLTAPQIHALSRACRAVEGRLDLRTEFGFTPDRLEDLSHAHTTLTETLKQGPNNVTFTATKRVQHSDDYTIESDPANRDRDDG